MTDSILSSISTARIKIDFIGTLPITDPEVWNNSVKEIFKNSVNSELSINVVAESDNQLFQHSLRTDTNYYAGSLGRQTFTQLKFRRDMVLRELKPMITNGKKHEFKISTINLPLYMIMIDSKELWYLPVTSIEENLPRFKKISDEDDWRHIVKDSFSAIIDHEKDGRYVTSPNSELLEIFDQDHIPRGIFPRSCFYDTDHFQYVVWGFVFSRDGELLIHKRGVNAKDNQNLWDKSIGGHIDYKKERSTSQAVVRELIEELYTKEQIQQSGRDFSLLSEDPEKVYYLGDWRPGEWGPAYLDQVGLLESGAKVGEEFWVYYKIPGVTARNTPRILPNGNSRRLRVLADVYIFIANSTLTSRYAKENLKNSEYRLAMPGQIKSWIEMGTDDYDEQFISTSDLEYIMTGKLRDVIDEVSQFIQYASFRKIHND